MEIDSFNIELKDEEGFLEDRASQGAFRVVVGGGFRDSRLGELAIARTEIILKSEGYKIEMIPIHHHPDEAGPARSSSGDRASARSCRSRAGHQEGGGPSILVACRSRSGRPCRGCFVGLRWAALAQVPGGHVIIGTSRVCCRFFRQEEPSWAI